MSKVVSSASVSNPRPTLRQSRVWDGKAVVFVLPDELNAVTAPALVTERQFHDSVDAFGVQVKQATPTGGTGPSHALYWVSPTASDLLGDGVESGYYVEMGEKENFIVDVVRVKPYEEDANTEVCYCWR